MSVQICKQPMVLKIMKAQCYLQQRDTEKASTMLLEILAEQPDHWLCLCLLLNLYLPQKTDASTVSWRDLCHETCQLTKNLQIQDAIKAEKITTADPKKAEEAFEMIQKLFNGWHVSFCGMSRIWFTCRQSCGWKDADSLAAMLYID